MRRAITTLVYIIWLTTGCQVQQNINSTVDATTGLGAIPKGHAAERNLAIAQAKITFQQKQALEDDLTDGPCLSNRIVDDWVADIVHSPRIPTDDQPENQCANYRNGTAHHFVELDLEGNIIRAE